MTVADVKAMIDASGIGYSVIAAHFDRSGSWLSMVLAGKRTCNPDQLLRMIAVVQAIRAERDAAFAEALSGLVTPA